jgi:hypothetical protein
VIRLVCNSLIRSIEKLGRKTVEINFGSTDFRIDIRRDPVFHGYHITVAYQVIVQTWHVSTLSRSQM